MTPAAPQEFAPPHRVRTTNISTNSSNLIHDDVTAKRYGFSGGLVAGTLMYAHMTTPLVAKYGAAWLADSRVEVRLLNPAYEGEHLEVRTSKTAEGDVEARLLNADGADLAWLGSTHPAQLPPVDALAATPPRDFEGDPPPVSWDALEVGRPFRALTWQPDRAEHEAWCSAASDTLPLYQGASAVQQPGLVLQGVNAVFSHNYRLDPWIHVSSVIHHRAPLRMGKGGQIHAVQIRAVPVEKWERKGHQFLRFYASIHAAEQVAVEAWHTAIFKVRPVGE